MHGNHRKDPAEKWPGAGIQDLQPRLRLPLHGLGNGAASGGRYELAL
jgi:hypothetical protein